MLAELTAAVAPVDAAATAAALARHDRLAKPPGSLGRLEELGARLAGIAGVCPPPVPHRPVVLVAAADHGVHAQGISDWPQAVTGAMVDTVTAGRAAVNALARTVGAVVEVVDVGVATPHQTPAARDGERDDGERDDGERDDGERDDGERDGERDDGERCRGEHGRVRAGTRDLTVGPAMTVAECRAAIDVGAEVARAAVADGADLVALGDLGIGNTTASACLIAALTGAAPEAVTGRGANRDDACVARKIGVVRQALDRHGRDREPLALLASLGGLEHAAHVGMILAAAAARIPVVLDGVITGASALVAVALVPGVRDYVVAGHASAEPGARVALDHLGLQPLLDLELRLGEGTGAVLAVPLVQAAARTLGEMALLEEVAAPPVGRPHSGSCTLPSSRSGRPGLWATSHKCPSGSRK